MPQWAAALGVGWATVAYHWSRAFLLDETYLQAPRARGRRRERLWSRAPAPRALPHPMTHDSDPFLVVGLGASAGGLSALEAFFAGLPKTDGAAFVVVVHLAPDRESEMAEILGRSVPIPFVQVTEPVKVERGHVYVIPPDRNLLMEDGHLRLAPLEDERHRRRPIDHFFRTLAEAWGEHAVGVVLSGTGHNGTVGAGRIRERGGLVLAQDPADAAFDEMPRSAIASGVVDRVATAAELAKEVIDYAARLQHVRLSDDAGDLPGDDVEAVRHILAQLRVHTGHDFEHYKRATVLRRLARRLHVVGAGSLVDYLGYLRGHPDEAQALLDDLLIHVTNFFRDPAAFARLAEAMPAVFEGKRAGDEVRVWVAGCATGEEAYSVAILLCEHAASLREPPTVQVFATDLSADAIQTARLGVYPASIEADVTPARLREHFVKTPAGYRVREALRERVLFAPHSLLKDPPFAHLDLVTCRNLLIYLQRDLQRRTLELFHYALRPGGLLLLGASETADPAGGLFEDVDKGAHLYRARDVASALPRVSTSRRVAPPAPPPPAEPETSAAALHQRLRASAAAPSVLVDASHDVVHFSDGLEPFLQLGGGDPTQSVLRLVVPALRASVQTALFQARGGGAVTTGPVTVAVGGEPRAVRVHAEGAEGGLARVAFLARPAAPAPVLSDDAHVRALSDELQETREQLQLTVEEFETSREELRAQNEELQSINEELRSTAEELETSKEEAQSMAEELQTVNDELKHKVEELAQASGDLENLIAATEIATLFLDRELRIQWFTPQVRRHFRIRSSDIGRPLDDLAQTFGGDRLAEDAEAVLERLEVQQREVESADGRCHLVQVRPYQSDRDRVEGVVVTFVDITERRRQEDAVARTAEEFQALVAASAQAVWATDAGGRVVEDSPSWRAFTGQTTAEWLGEGWADAVHPDDRAGALARWRAAVAAGEPYQNTFRLRRTDGEWRWVQVRAVPVHHADGAVRGWVGANEDVTERRRAEDALRASEARYRTLFESIGEGFCLIEVVADETGAPADYRFVETNPAFEAHTGLSDVVGRTAREAIPGLEDVWVETYGRVAATGERARFEEVSDAMGRWFSVEAIPVGEAAPYKVAVLFADITERKGAEMGLEASVARASFRATLADALRPVTDPAEIESETARVLGEHLGASRVHYAEVDEDGTWGTVEADYAVGVEPMVGRHTLADYGRALAEAIAGGGTFVVSDAATDPRLSAEARRATAARDVAAYVVVPMVKGGQTRALLSVHAAAPRDWTEAEVALVEETAARTWTALEAARAEAALRQTETRFRQAVDAARLGTWSFEIPPGPPEFDARARQLFGLGDGPLTDAQVAACIHPDDRAGFEAARAAALDPDGPGVFAETHRVVWPSGEVRWVRGQAEVAFETVDGERRPVRAAGVVFDVTEQHAAQAALRESEERFRETAETVPDVLFAAAPDGRVTYVSAQLEAYTGVPPHEVVGTTLWLHLVHPDDRAAVEAAWAEACATGERFEQRYRLSVRDDGYLWVMTRARPVLDAGGELAHWSGTVTDIEALIQAERAVQAANETLEARVAERTAQARDLAAQLTVAEQTERERLAHVLHDDLQQQLYGLSLLLVVARTSPPEAVGASLARAETIVAEATALTRSLSSDLNPIVLESERVEDLARWVAERERGQDRLAIEVAGEGRVRDSSVRALLYQAMRELLFNVVKHAGTDRVRIDIDEGEDLVRVAIEDEGEGFDASANGHGEGFGLPSIRNRLSVVGGRIEIASTPGAGTRAVVVVPSGSG